MNERTNEWMCGWIVRALLLWHARVCPLVCTCSTEYSLFFFYCCCCWCCRLWVLFFVSFPFYFRFSRDYRVGRVSLQNTHTHKITYIPNECTHDHTHTHTEVYFFLIFWQHLKTFRVFMRLFRRFDVPFLFLFFWRSRKTKTTDQKKKNRKKALSGKYVCYRKIKENTMAI